MAANSAATSTMKPLKYLISGGARGLGRGLARSLLLQGHKVFLLDSNESELNHTLNIHLPKLKESSVTEVGKFSGSLTDISSIQSIKTSMSKVAKFYGDSFDVLVNNASRTNPYWKSGDGKIEDVDPSEWKNFVDINLNGTFYLTQAALPFLRKSELGPSIINVSSTRSLMSEPFQEGYASTVNAILPGWIPSDYESEAGDQASLSWDHELNEQDHKQHWSGRAGTIEDLHQTVVYLSGCGFITGQEIVIDGGMTKKMIYEE